MIFAYIINFLSVSIAAIALLLTIGEIRRNNNIIVKTKNCSSGKMQNVKENNGQLFNYFKITIQNKGINLYEPRMSLSFRNEEGGTINLPLLQEKQTNIPVDTFSKGMIASFYFKEYVMEDIDKNLLCLLRNAQKQDACLCLYSQNYLAKIFRINSIADRMKRKWNHLSSKFSFRRKKGKNYEGMDIVKTYQLPTFQTSGGHVEFFIQLIRQ